MALEIAFGTLNPHELVRDADIPVQISVDERSDELLVPEDRKGCLMLRKGSCRENRLRDFPAHANERIDLVVAYE